MRKRLFSILLALCMVLCLVPTTAFAEDSTEETPECTCEKACTEETMNAECPVCGAKGALAENCGKYAEPAAEGEASQPEGEKTQKNKDSDMPDTQSEEALAQMSGEGENGIAVQSAGVAIDNTNFPDANFRTIVKNFDTNKDGNLSDTEIAAVEKIYCTKKGITNLKGIEYFTALKKLKCFENQLTSLDVSKNTALTYLDCYSNQLTSLDVSKNTTLFYLGCSNNQLTSLDISNTKINALYRKGNNYQIVVDNDRTFDLSTLPGNFDVTKTSDWSGGTVNGNMLTVDSDKDTVTYKYDCGKWETANFTLKCTQVTQGLGVYVNGEQFTSEKLSIACGEGTASYDPNTKTLTLDNATITNGGKSDESPKYGIRVVGDTDLTIKLSGTNSITLDNGGGIFADGSSDNYNIIGGGKLTINVKWDALYTLNGNISISEGAELDITSAKGCGITSYNKGILSIDGAKVAVSSYYTAASAKELEVKNGSEVVLSASEDRFNAVYMGDENGAGKIEIINSKVEATSYYPALFTEGNLTVNGGEVKCTSTADGAIWTKGNILIKGGAKVTTDGKYPMGGNGTFTVEEAEIDAKNTNENNIPAIFDECVPVIADGYHLNYAKAVDSEGTEIDLLSSGTQYFALYKNVHFITKAVYPVSFVVTPDGLTNVVVKVNGQEVTGSVSLEAGTYPVEVTADNCKAYSGNITITADTATHTQTIAMTYLPADYTKVDAAIAEAKAKALNKDDYKNFSAVEDAVNAVVRNKNITEQSEVDAMADAINNAIADLQYKDANYDKVDAAIAKANKLNKDDYKDFSGVDSAMNAVMRDKNITEQSEVDAMAKKIEDAIAALQYKDADYAKVDEAIAKANALKKDDYKDFTGVETAVKAVVRDKNITEQSEVDKMAKTIEDAIAALQYKDADYTKVDEAITKANALKKDDYKDFTGVEAAVKAVVRGKNITGQSEVDKMAKTIEDAIAALEKKPANTKPGTSDKSPQTGDTSNLALWITLLFISGGAAVGTTVVSRKKKYNK